jgi:hypothetical protein
VETPSLYENWEDHFFFANKPNGSELALCFFAARSVSKPQGIFAFKNTPRHKVYVHKSTRLGEKVEIW